MKRLDGKRALIAGGASGIGLESARLFLAEGARVAITGADEMEMKAAASSLGSDVLAIQADAGDLASPQRIAADVQRCFGGLDVAFVDVGSRGGRPFQEWDVPSFDHSVAVNLKWPFFLIQTLLPILANPSSVVLNASIDGRIGTPACSVHASTTAALASLARMLSAELIGRGIRVNAIRSGPIATPVRGRQGLRGAALDELVSQIPAGRRGRAREIAQAVVYLASDDGAFTVGSEFVIDGGMSTL